MERTASGAADALGKALRPWAPPYIWPPYGGEEALGEFTDAMHKAGDRVGLYASGIGWTQQSMLEPGYDCREQFEAEELENEICTGPRGEAYSRNCNGAHSIRLGYDLCPARDTTARIVCNEISAAHRRPGSIICNISTRIRVRLHRSATRRSMDTFPAGRLADPPQCGRCWKRRPCGGGDGSGV